MYIEGIASHRVGVAASVGLFLSVILAWVQPAWSGEVGFAEYYVLGDEDDLIEAYKAIPNSQVPASAAGSNINSRVCIVSSAGGAHVYLDEWEDGYDFDPSDPYNTADAKWDAAAGGSGEAGDALSKGEVLVLTETNRYVSGSEGVDGGDRIYISGAPVSVVRIVWPDDPGSYIAGAWELYPEIVWQDKYTVPIGVDLTYTNSSYPFEYTFLFIEAGRTNTRIVVTAPSEGVIVDTNLAAGESIYLTNVNSGTHIAASDPVSGVARPVQAAVMSSVNEFVDTRFFTLTPEIFLGTDYLLPAPSQQFIPGEFSGTSTNAAYIFAFESNTTVNIVTYHTNVQVLLTNRYDVYRFELPFLPYDQTSGLYGTEISSVDSTKKIWVLVAADDDDDVVDWGYQALNMAELSQEYFSPYGPANPVHITPQYDNTTVWIDFDNDGTNDKTIVLDKFETYEIYDPDHDGTGARYYSDKPVAVAWGQDNTQQSPGEPLPDYDYGYTLLPLYWRDPVLGIQKSADPTNLPSEGGTSEFTLVVSSYTSTVYNIDISDKLPPGWSYVSNSTLIVFSDGSPNMTNEPSGAPGPDLSWDLDHDLTPTQTITLTFSACTVSGQYTYGWQVNEAEAWGYSVDDETNVNAQAFNPSDYCFVYIPQTAVLSVSKSSSATGTVDPGDTITYTITITNIGSAQQTGIRVRDYLPSGMTYVANSTWVASPGTGSNTVRDEFNTQSYTSNDGTTEWANDWQESEGDGPTAGDLQVLADVSNYQLRFRDDNLWIYRSADLSGATAAVLSLLYRRDSLDNANEWVELLISSNGAAPWTVLDQYAGAATDSSYIYTNYDITAHIGTNTTVAFWNDNRRMRNGDRVWFDDVEIAYLSPPGTETNAGGAPPILADGYSLGPGEVMVVTLQATVDDPATVTQLVNIAYVRSDQQDQLEASVTNDVIAATLGDWVWYDSNTNGVQDAGETGGVEAVTVRLYDSTSNLIDSVQTDSGGYYEFNGLGPGDYFLTFEPPTNYFFSPQDQGGDDALDSDADPTNGTTSVFNLLRGTNMVSEDAGLYVPPASIGDYAWFDANTNGLQDAGESAMTNITVRLYGSQSNLVDSTQTDSSGHYLFEDVFPGDYFLEFENPVDYTFTLRDQGSDDGVDSDVYKITHRTATFTVSAQEAATNWDAGYILPVSGLRITKSSDAGVGCLSPGDTVEYTILVENTGTVSHLVQMVYDEVPAGATYVSNSTRVVGYGVASNTVRDEFNAVAYTNNDGSTDWLGPWVENDPYGNSGPVGDYVGVTNGRLRIHYAYVGDERAERAVDLSGYTSAVLSFDWETVGLDAGETISALISTDGVNFTTLDTFGGTASGWTNYDITGYISPSTTVRFANESQNWEAGEMVFFDNVEISMLSAPGIVTNAGGPPPVLAEGYTVDTGQTLTVTFQVTVDSPGSVSELINTGSVVSATHPAISDVVTDCVLHADLALQKTATDTEPSEGESIQYILTLTNNGPDDGSGIQVSDLLPSGVTYHSHSNGVYNEVTGIWDVGDLVSGVSTTLYIVVGVDEDTAGQEITNTASVSARDLYDPVASNDTSSVVISPVPTLVVISHFAASIVSEKVVLEWETASEVGTLGFYIYRFESNHLVRVNDKLLPGLLTAPQGGRYRYIDESASPRGVLIYRICEVGVDGARHWYGPFHVEPTATGETRLMGRRGFAKSKPGSWGMDEYDRKARTSGLRARARRLQHAALVEGMEESRRRLFGNLLKLEVETNGIYFVSRAELAERFALPEWYVEQILRYHYLALSTCGDAVSYWVPSDDSGLFFYGEKGDGHYSDKNVYWLGWGEGRLMDVMDCAGGGAEVQQTYRATRHFEEDRWPSVGLFHDPDADFWLWDFVIAGSPSAGCRDFVVDVPAPADGGGDAQLKLHFKGASSTRHDAVVKVNGTVLGEVTWEGLSEHDGSWSFPQGVLVAGDNVIEVEGLLGDGVPYSVFAVDSIDLEYESRCCAQGDAVVLPVVAGMAVRVTGFSTDRVAVLEISDPRDPKWVKGADIESDGAGGWAVMLDPSIGAHRCLVAGEGAWMAPVCVPAGDYESLLESEGADYVIITVPELEDSAELLAQYRRSQGWTPLVADVESVYDAFNYGNPSPDAIRRFLDYAYTYWSRPPVCVLLMGKGTYDYRDIQGYGDNLIPVKLVGTAHGLFAADNWYGDVVGDDDVPEMAIGRLPVLNPSEVTDYVDKVVAYEGGDGDWTRSVILAADNGDDGGNFTADSESMAGLIPSAYSLTRSYLDWMDIETARTVLLDAFDGGAGLLNYMGHGGLDRMAQEGLLTKDDVGGIHNAGKTPFVIGITCVIGRYELPGYDSLAETLVICPQGGAAAVWSPSGMSMHNAARILDDAFLRAHYISGADSAGDCILQALEHFRDTSEAEYLLQIYNLLGDPALLLK